jgi:hypothetical protein
MKIRNLETGLVHERSPVDSQEAVRGGGYEFADAAVPSVREVLAGLTGDELEAMAREAGVRTLNEQRDYIVARLVPLVEQGRVALP